MTEDTSLRQTRVAVAGHGAIGGDVAGRLARGAIPNIRLTAVSARDLNRLARDIAWVSPPLVVAPPAGIVEHADIVVEAATAEAFPEIARATLEAGKILVPVSVSAMPRTPGLAALAERHGGRIVMPSGGMYGLDVVKAAAEDGIGRSLVRMWLTPQALANETYVKERGVKERGFDISGELAEPVLVFRGTVSEAAIALPNHCNSAVTLSMAGIGDDRTMVEVFVQSGLPGARSEVELDAEAITVRMSAQHLPSHATPRTSRVIAPSVMATLRSLVAPIVIGT